MANQQEVLREALATWRLYQRPVSRATAMNILGSAKAGTRVIVQYVHMPQTNVKRTSYFTATKRAGDMWMSEDTANEGNNGLLYTANIIECLADLCVYNEGKLWFA